jgi:His-Xaa-Ser system protein HxsD
MDFEFTNNELRVVLDSSIYNLDVIHKCFYWYGNNYVIDINKTSNSLIHVTLEPKDNIRPLLSNTELIEKIKQDLIDFKLRDIVTQETKNVRELLIAKAFAYYEVNNDPETNISDPVGFKP